MIDRQTFFRRSTGSVILAAAIWGCDAKLPVAETPAPPVSVSQPVVHEVVDQDDYEGRIAAAENVEVRARVRGHLVKVSFKDGQIIKKGDPMFEIDPRTYQASLDAAEAQKSAAEANLELAKKEYARTSTLVRSGAASREELDVWTAKQGTAAADRLKAMASVEQAKLDLDFTKVAAPIDGKTSRTQVTEGNLVNAGGGETMLTTITSVDPMYVYFDVDERALLRYREHFRKGKTKDGGEPSVKELQIPIKVGLEGEKGFPHEGVIDFADNHVNPSTGTIQVRGVVPNPKHILDAGMRARVRVPVSDPRKSLMITERAVGTDQGRKFVYVVTDQNVAERRDVELGRLADGLQVIKEGLKPEDWVVVNGIQRVRDGAKVERKPVPMPGASAEQTNQQTAS
jgi:RND family efflux transporter MFP subunit